jgi:divalent metal cation (Fe/Co/Zn/Cd) transporter
MHPDTTAPAGPSADRRALVRRALRLEYATIAWNALEGVVTIAAGIVAGSVSLVAFGLDSGVEVFASAVVVWEIQGRDRSRERLALRLIGLGYLVVAVYVAWQAVSELLSGHRPDASPIGIAFLAATVAAMVLLGLGKGRVGRQLGSATVLADSRFSFIDGGLAGAVLIGLVLTAVLGWWWADPVLALVVCVIAAREGVEAIRGEEDEDDEPADADAADEGNRPD